LWSLLFLVNVWDEPSHDASELFEPGGEHVIR